MKTIPDTSRDLLDQVAPLRMDERACARYWGVLRAEQRGARMTFTEGHLLMELEARGDLGVSELADILQMTRPSTSRTLRTLRQRRWVSVRDVPTDLRKKMVSLTSFGRQALAKLHAEVEARERRILSVLSPDERLSVLRGFELYATAVRRLASDVAADPSNR